MINHIQTLLKIIPLQRGNKYVRKNHKICQAIIPCKDKFNQYDTVKGITICEQILYDYKNVNSEVYQELINLIYLNKDIARTVINGASNGGYSYLLISLFKFESIMSLSFIMLSILSNTYSVVFLSRVLFYLHKLIYNPF